MRLTPGSMLDHYEVLELIGEGGMGEVYRARDTRLPREVAIKVSGEKFNERFTREAKIIAALNHPNICTLFDVGPDYLVMEMVEGPTLADRIQEGALSLQEAARIAGQVSEALDYAHEKGVVHRDLKPGNVKIRTDGLVKVLDFGLAKTGAVAAARPGDSPTITMTDTQAGIVLGTAAYMAPEQALGKPVDKRADIWAFGVVFYEMLTGARMHKGDTLQETLASVLKDEPDLSKVTAQAHRLLKLCLEKDPNRRLKHIGDAMQLLDETPSGSQSSAAIPAVAAPSRRNWLWPAALAAVVAGVAIWAMSRSSAPMQTVRFEVAPSDEMRFGPGAAMAVSPDGRWMVFPATSPDGVVRFWIRSLDGVEARPLPGSETGGNPPPAAWTADSRYVLFSGGGGMKKIDIQGGPPQVVAERPGAFNGATENREGVVLFGAAPGNAMPILRVALAGGAPAPVTALGNGDVRHAFPQFLPDRKHFLYLKVSRDPNKTGVYIGSLDDKPDAQSQERLLATDREAYYAASAGGGGHLVFLRDSTLMGQPFDAAGMKLSGEPFPMATGVASFPAANYGMFSVSDTGVLVYRGGASAQPMLTWFDEQGRPSGTIGEPGNYQTPAISPDGERVVVGRSTEAPTEVAPYDLWILDSKRGTSSRFTFDPGSEEYPRWSPDGKSIAFSSNRAGKLDIYVKPADGSAEEKLLYKSDLDKALICWSPDGRYILFAPTNPKTREDIWGLPVASAMQGDPKPFPILQTPASESLGELSPDGRWLAYVSVDGRPEVYVRPFSPEATAPSGPKWLVSTGNALIPHWRGDGKQLFYVSLSGEVSAVEIDAGKSFQAGKPRRLFVAPGLNLISTGWDVAPDGKRFLLPTANAGKPSPFVVVLNWLAGVKK